MKPISIVLLCLFAMAPFLLMAEVRSNALTAALSLRSHYDAVIDNALSDTADRLAASVTGHGYSDVEAIHVDADLAVEEFLDALADGLGAETASARARIAGKVPVMVVALHDSAVLYALLPVPDEEGQARFRHVCFPEVPYVWNDTKNACLIGFTMSSEVRVFDRETGETDVLSWQEAQVGGTQLFASEEDFVALRLRTLRDVVTGLMENGLQLSQPEGQHGSFDLPAAQDAAFRNGIRDVGMFAFLQGLPVGSEKTYQTFAFGGGRIVRRKPVTGWSNQGRRIYCRADCDDLLQAMGVPGFEMNDLRYFANPEEAASEGYAPCSLCRP